VRHAWRQCRAQVRCASWRLKQTTHNKERLLDLAKHWNVLALDLDGTIELLDQSTKKTPQK
jgi:hypothetical protein